MSNTKGSLTNFLVKQAGARYYIAYLCFSFYVGMINDGTNV